MQDNKICHFVILIFPKTLCIVNGQFYWHKNSEDDYDDMQKKKFYSAWII